MILQSYTYTVQYKIRLQQYDLCNRYASFENGTVPTQEVLSDFHRPQPCCGEHNNNITSESQISDGQSICTLIRLEKLAVENTNYFTGWISDYNAFPFASVYSASVVHVDTIGNACKRKSKKVSCASSNE